VRSARCSRFFTLWTLKWVDLVIPREHRARLRRDLRGELERAGGVAANRRTDEISRAVFQRQEHHPDSSETDYAFELSWRRPRARHNRRSKLFHALERRFTVKSFELTTDKRTITIAGSGLAHQDAVRRLDREAPAPSWFAARCPRPVPRGVTLATLPVSKPCSASMITPCSAAQICNAWRSRSNPTAGALPRHPAPAQRFPSLAACSSLPVDAQAMVREANIKR